MCDLIKTTFKLVQDSINDYLLWFMPEPVKTDKTIQEAWKRLAINAIELNKDFEPKGQHWFYAIHSLSGIPTKKTRESLPKGHPLELLSLTAGNEHKVDTITKELKSLLGDIKKAKEIDFSELIFDECIDFSNFIFPIDTKFNKAKFITDVYFNNAVFSETADFEETEFQEKESHCKETAKFRNTTFEKIANFRNAIFWGYANFKGAKLKGRAFFQEAKFKWHAPRFYDAKFNNEITWAGIELPNFRKAPVDKCRKATDDELTNGSKKFVYIEHKDIFKNFKTFKTLETFKTIKENRIRRIEENQNSYENTSILLEERKKHHDQHLFFREEMQCRRRLENNVFICLAFGLYGGLAGYGYGIGRAFTAWFLHIFFGTIAIFIIAYCGGLEIWQALFCSVSTSFANANPFVFFGFKEGALMDCYECLHDLSPLLFGSIRGLQTVIGIPILFLLLTTLRVRFRLK